MVKTKVIITILFLFFSFNSLQSKVSNKSFLWKVESDKTTVYILGSIHVGTKKMYPLNPRIMKAFEDSDYLVLEINNDELSDTKKRELVQKYMFYKSPDTLKNHISNETLQLIEQTANSLKLPMDKLIVLRPLYLYMVLVYTKLYQSGYDLSYGIDKFFEKLAKKRGKKIIGIEPYEYRARFFFDLSGKALDSLIKYTIQDIDRTNDLMKQLIRYWVEGNIVLFDRTVQKLFKNRLKFKPFKEKLIIRRNKEMFGKIKGYLKDTKKYFVVVGSGHLTGKEGIIELLKAKGYSSQQL